MGNTVSHSVESFRFSKKSVSVKESATSDAASARSGVRTLGKTYELNIIPLTHVPGLHIVSNQQVLDHSIVPGVHKEEITFGEAVTPSVAVEPSGRIWNCSAGVAGCSIVWELDIQQVFAVEDTSRSPCGSNTQIASPVFHLSAQLEERSSLATNCLQQLHVTEQRSQRDHTHPQHSKPTLGGDWRFVWAMFDQSDHGVSLYLLHQPNNTGNAAASQPTDPHDTGDAKVAPSCCTSALPVAWSVDIQGVAADGRTAHRFTCCVPVHDYASSNGGPVTWGVHSLLTLSELDQLITSTKLRLVATLQHPVAEPKQVDAKHAGVLCPGAMSPAPFDQLVLANRNNNILSGGTSFVGHTTTGCNATLGNAAAPCIPAALIISLSPRIIMVDQFMEPSLCDAVMNLSRPRLVRSRVSTGTETPSRTSRGTFFTGASAQHPLILEVESRISQLMASPAVIAGKKQLVNSEALQVVAYNKGDFYTEHFDNKQGGSVSRFATIIIYLCDTSKGGGTLFPRATGLPSDQDLNVASITGPGIASLTQHLHEDAAAKRCGVRILPVKGRAVIFWSALPDGSEDLASLHAAEPVRQGEKWILTRWFKECSE